MSRTPLHRRIEQIPALAPEGAPLQIPPWTYASNRAQYGCLAHGGCVHGGQSASIWAPLHDQIALTNGPCGCAHYAQANRPGPGPNSGISDFSSINFGTDIEEREIVFGGNAKLTRAVSEAHGLFPLHRGMNLLATCPIALIGDDCEAVARDASGRTGQPVAAIPCAGYRRSDGIGETHAHIARLWRASKPPDQRSSRNAVTLLCRLPAAASDAIAVLLGEIGLDVVARWPSASSRNDFASLREGALIVSVGMPYWAQLLEGQFGQTWIDAEFLGPEATHASLRAIAAHFDASVGARVEELIARTGADAESELAPLRARLSSQLFFSFSPLKAQDAALWRFFGMRVGSFQQGWPDEDGVWQEPEDVRPCAEISPSEMRAVLKRARPSIVDGIGQNGEWLAKLGQSHCDARSRLALAYASCGYAGTPALHAEVTRLACSPLRHLFAPMWNARSSAA